MIETGAYIALIILTVAFILSFRRLLAGPSLPDRVIALELLTSISIGIIVTFIFISKKTIYLDIVLIIAPIVFIGTVTIAKYLQDTKRKV